MSEANIESLYPMAYTNTRVPYLKIYTVGNDNRLKAVGEIPLGTAVVVTGMDLIDNVRVQKLGIGEGFYIRDDEFANEDEPEVSMSPLIDCVFLLLIFFLVSTMTKVKNRDISVDLPTSESAIKLKPDDKQAIVGLDAEGNFYWDGQPCSTNFMMEQLRETCISDPGRRIRIDMDKNTPFGRFVEVMDACQFYNLTNIGIRTYDENYNRE